MITNLDATKPDAELQESLELFGQFIGDWKIHSTWYLPNNEIVKGTGHVSFGWILYGTAIQDVWTGEPINPPDNFPKRGFGTTIRIFDNKFKVWNCVWVAPVSSVIMTFIAKKRGEEIVLEGTNKTGKKENWIYSNITSESFDWRAEISPDTGNSWILDQVITATRVPT